MTFNDYLLAIGETLLLTLASTAISYVLGAPLGILLYGTANGSIFPNKPVNKVLGLLVNVFRSIPFIIMLVMVQPLAKILVGTKMGNAAFVFYLVVAATPFVARMVESSLKEVDGGMLEAAQSMGSTNFQIICKVLIPEAKPSLLVGAAIALTTILGYTPMAYLVSGGGLGAMAIRYGLYRFEPKIMYITSILLIIIVQVIQETVTFAARKTDKRVK